MSEGLIEAARRLGRLLEALGRPAAIIGGIAINARVRVRATRDVDALIAIVPGDVVRLVQLAREQGYDPGTSPEQDLREMGMVRLWGPPGRPGGTIADLIVADVPYLQEAVARATPVSFSGLELPMATVEDLLVMKLDANRPLDLDDAIAIKDAFAQKLDLAYVRRQADSAGAPVRRRFEVMFGP